jgi:NAD(P)-dependent dehydrogenase (short-subunit alcohol dehydrogenase family)
VTSAITLADKNVLISGASRGIGAAIAAACAGAGARVILASRKQEALEAVASEIGHAALAIACHVGKPDEIDALFARVKTEVGELHGLVNNAATNPYFGPMLGIEDAAFDKTFEVNLRGPFYLTRAFVNQAQPGAAIVNMASIAGMAGAPLQGVYGMTKAALISMTQTLAHELGSLDIRVNAIAPGLVETRFASALVANPELLQRWTSRTALGRHGQPDEIAGAAVYLLSDAASYMTGQVMVIDGGSAPAG